MISNDFLMMFDWMKHQLSAINKPDHMETKSPKGPLELVPVELDDSYKKQWNVHSSDTYSHLYFQGKKLRNTLYRLGGLTTTINKPKYFLILKYIESYYSDVITTDPNQKAHLEGYWVIMDNTGKELVEFKQFEKPYIFQDSVIYTIHDKFYNIETGELICSCHNYIKSDHYLFLENRYDSDETRRGVIVVDKKTGSYEIIK